MRSRKVRCGKNTVLLHQDCVSFRPCSVGDDGAALSVEIDHSEHLSAKSFIADPEDKVGAPLHRLDNMWQLQQHAAYAFGVHAPEYNEDSAQAEPDRPLRLGGINDFALLRYAQAPSFCQPAGGFTRGLHQTLPVAAGLVATYALCRF